MRHRHAAISAEMKAKRRLLYARFRAALRTTVGWSGFLAGFGAFVYGVFLLAGIGWALIVGGIFVMLWSAADQ